MRQGKTNTAFVDDMLPPAHCLDAAMPERMPPPNTAATPSQRCHVIVTMPRHYGAILLRRSLGLIFIGHITTPTSLLNAIIVRGCIAPRLRCHY